MLRRFSDLLCSKCCFYSLILAFIISLGYINIANAYVCFLPDNSDCADGNYKDFWPCSGSDCIDAKDGECDASYNSNKSNNDCGDVCTKCADSSSPYNGLYKCPENTCNCNEYTSTSAYNECGESCKVCRIAGDKNYGKYKCPAVPEEGCANPQCEDYTLTKNQADEITTNGGICEQCTNQNAPISRQKLYKCEDCNPNIYTKTLEGCAAEGYDSAKDKCGNGDVYQACCRTCDGYMYPTDLSKTSEGWSCTECPNFCGGGSKYSCGCKEGYHDDGYKAQWNRYNGGYECVKSSSGSSSGSVTVEVVCTDPNVTTNQNVGAGSFRCKIDKSNVDPVIVKFNGVEELTEVGTSLAIQHGHTMCQFFIDGKNTYSVGIQKIKESTGSSEDYTYGCSYHK